MIRRETKLILNHSHLSLFLWIPTSGIMKGFRTLNHKDTKRTKLRKEKRMRDSPRHIISLSLLLLIPPAAHHVLAATGSHSAAVSTGAVVALAHVAAATCRSCIGGRINI